MNEVGQSEEDQLKAALAMSVEGEQARFFYILFFRNLIFQSSGVKLYE